MQDIQHYTRLGWSNKQIADELGVSVQDVEKWRKVKIESCPICRKQNQVRLLFSERLRTVEMYCPSCNVEFTPEGEVFGISYAGNRIPLKIIDIYFTGGDTKKRFAVAEINQDNTMWKMTKADGKEYLINYNNVNFVEEV